MGSLNPENTHDERNSQHGPVRMPLGLTNLDNRAGSTIGHSTQKPISRMFCDSAQFYAGNERSSSLVTAIPAETQMSAGSTDATAILFDRLIIARLGIQLCDEAESSPLALSSAPEPTADSLSSIISSADNLTLQDILSSPTLGKKLLALQSASKNSPHVHFASPLEFVNTYTPEFDAISGSTGSSSNVQTSDLRPPLSPEVRFFPFKQAIANLEKELEALELEETELEKEEAASLEYVKELIPLQDTIEMQTSVIRDPLFHSESVEPVILVRKAQGSSINTLDAKRYPKQELVNNKILRATQGIPSGTVENYSEVMLEMASSASKFSGQLEKRVREDTCRGPEPNTTRGRIVKSKTVAKNLAELGSPDSIVKPEFTGVVDKI